LGALFVGWLELTRFEQEAFHRREVVNLKEHDRAVVYPRGKSTFPVFDDGDV
jgi:hypothetical protein